MDNFLDRVRSSDLDEEGLYFLGILKAGAEGFKIDCLQVVQSLFRNSAFEAKLRDVKQLILHGQVCEVLEVMRRSECNLCQRYSSELVPTMCGHFFHNECLIKDISQNLGQHCSYLCPCCKAPIQNMEELSIKIKALIRSHRITEILEGNQEITICPICGNLCEVDSEPAYCYNCQTNFCEYCLQPCECLCDSSSAIK